MQNLSFLRPLLAAALATAAGAAAAHVTLDYQVANAGASYKAAFRVGHGCGAAATRQLVVDIPAGVRGAHPMPKPGWRIDLDRGADVTRVTWTARTPEDALPSAWYDEFVVVAQMPAQAGTIYWPVRQVCTEGQADWTEVPKPGQKLSDLKGPAAALELLPADGAGASHAGH